MARHNDVRIIAGFNQDPTADGDNIEDITPSSGSTFNIPGVGSVYYAVSTDPDFSLGQDRYSPVPSSSRAGYKQVRYNQPMCHKDALKYLLDTYEGAVTAYLKLDGTSYADYNCWLRFEYQKLQNRPEWYDVTWVFTIVEAL